MTGSSFITYQIVTSNPTSPNLALHTVLRRYSEFESLYKSLRLLYPTIVIPPIPEKHSLSAYAKHTSLARTKDDPKVILKRKRMLASFLNRLIRHPVLSREHLVHGFLEPGGWNEVLKGREIPKKEKKSVVGKVLGTGRLINPGKFLRVSTWNFGCPFAERF